MGFLNKLLKGLGFEDDEEKKKPVEKNKKEKIKVNNNVYASFDLSDEKETTKEQKVEKEAVQESFNTEQSSVAGFSIVKVKSQVEVQNIVNKIKTGERILLNLTDMSSADIIRSLDFLTGAVYALDKTMQKVDGNVYLIQ